MANFVKKIQFRQAAVAVTLCALLFMPSTFAAPDYSGLVLTESQKAVLASFEKKGMSDEKLLIVAKSFHKSNTKTGLPERPSYKFAEIMAVAKWARGGAISAFAEDAGYSFDVKSYSADCPNKVLFNFGRATATTYMPVDVLIYFNRDMYALARVRSEDNGKFQKLFLSIAQDSETMKYLTKL